jgi:hypothetical protein
MSFAKQPVQAGTVMKPPGKLGGFFFGLGREHAERLLAAGTFLGIGF